MRPAEIVGGAPKLDRLIHERLRLGILSALAVNESLTFNELKKLLETTDGNLSVHARKLEDAQYVACSKSFENRLPKTQYRLTAVGRRAVLDERGDGFVLQRSDLNRDASGAHRFAAVGRRTAGGHHARRSMCPRDLFDQPRHGLALDAVRNFVEAIQHQQTGAGQLLTEESAIQVPVVFPGGVVEIVDQPGGRVSFGRVVARYGLALADVLRQGGRPNQHRERAGLRKKVLGRQRVLAEQRLAGRKGDAPQEGGLARAGVAHQHHAGLLERLLQRDRLALVRPFLAFGARKHRGQRGVELVDIELVRGFVADLQPADGDVARVLPQLLQVTRGIGFRRAGRLPLPVANASDNLGRQLIGTGKPDREDSVFTVAKG